MTSLIRTEDLSLAFPVRGGFFQSVRSSVKAVNSVNLEVEEGKTLGIVGESGCGKTSLGRAMVRLYQPTSGKLFFRTTTEKSHPEPGDLIISFTPPRQEKK